MLLLPSLLRTMYSSSPGNRIVHRLSLGLERGDVNLCIAISAGQLFLSCILVGLSLQFPLVLCRHRHLSYGR